MSVFFTEVIQEVAAPTASDFVTRTGKYFECGREFTDMSGKPFTLTEAEADAAAAAFTGGPLNLEHLPTVLDNLLGSVKRLWRDGKDVHAEYDIPKWLHEATGGKPLKISSEWDMTTKLPIGAGLVLNPAVKDAVMMAAFSEGTVPLETLLAFANTRHNTPEGQQAMQSLHDISARSGAVCDRSNTASMASQHESTAVQKIHDIAADHGATCNKINDKAGISPGYYYSNKENKHMTSWEKIVAFCKGKGMTDEEATAILNAAPAPAASGMTETEKAEFTAAKTEVARLRKESLEKDAQAFADAQVKDRRALPAEVPALVAAFMQAAQDDGANPATVSFSVGTETKNGSRVDALKALFAARPPHILTSELMANGQNGAHLAALLMTPPTAEFGKEKPMTDTERTRLLSLSPLGQSVLAGRERNK